jgi:8-oxo-(d)GTP phosphatase
VHRPRYDDWSLPKGKADPDESAADCALREVEEETGLRCALEYELPRSDYLDALGREKRVRFWAMWPIEGEFAAGPEVDELRWLSPRDALELLSYERDRRVLCAFGHNEARSLLLVRHAAAGKRQNWVGDDRLRPLDERGWRQANGLVTVLAGHSVERIASSPYERCSQTVQPLATALGIAVELRDELAEGARTAEVRAVAAELGAGVLCVHGDAIESLLGVNLAKGSTTLLDSDLEPVATIPPAG